jgi:Stage II sporulation protein E (SpoIIE)
LSASAARTIAISTGQAGAERIAPAAVTDHSIEESREPLKRLPLPLAPVVTVGVLLTAALTLAASLDHQRTEDRLRDGHFTAVLIGLVDLHIHAIKWVNAGHPKSLMIHRHLAWLIVVPPGLPVGVIKDPSYQRFMTGIADDAVPLAYTDGLIKRSGETIDVGTDRLKKAAIGANQHSMSALLHSVRGRGFAENSCFPSADPRGDSGRPPRSLVAISAISDVVFIGALP